MDYKSTMPPESLSHFGDKRQNNLKVNFSFSSETYAGCPRRAKSLYTGSLYRGAESLIPVQREATAPPLFGWYCILLL